MNRKWIRINNCPKKIINNYKLTEKTWMWNDTDKVTSNLLVNMRGQSELSNSVRSL